MNDGIRGRPHNGSKGYGNPKVSIEAIGFGETERDATHSMLFVPLSQTEKP